MQDKIKGTEYNCSGFKLSSMACILDLSCIVVLQREQKEKNN